MQTYRKIKEATTKEIFCLIEKLVSPDSIKDIKYKQNEVEVTFVTSWVNNDKESIDIEDTLILQEFDGVSSDCIDGSYPLDNDMIYTYKQWCIALGFCTLYKNNPFVQDI